MSLQSSINNVIPPLPSTATVLDFICLFTHDLKRKQKRWQDGRLKFHTFNKRLMVYDDRGNSIGDTHWREDFEFGEGEEVQLDRGGVIVQVSDYVGRKEQDLSELVDKRVKDMELRHLRMTASSVSTPAPIHHSALHSQQTPRLHSNRRPLNELINTPGGRHGRAVISQTSPYEDRLHQPHGPQEDHLRPPKRRKRDVSPPSKSGYAQSLFGATLTLSSWSASVQPACPERRDVGLRSTTCEEGSSRTGIVRSFGSLQVPPSVENSKVIRDPAELSRQPSSSAKNGASETSARAGVSMPAERTKALPQATNDATRRRASELNGDRLAGHDDGIGTIKQVGPLVSARISRPPLLPEISPGQVMAEKPVMAVCSRKGTKSNGQLPPAPSARSQGDDGLLRKPSKTKAVYASACGPGIEGIGASRIGPTRLSNSDVSNIERPSTLVDEPKTELRIRSKPKRGLLMVSEKASAGKAHGRDPKMPASNRRLSPSRDNHDQKNPESDMTVRDILLEVASDASSHGAAKSLRGIGISVTGPSRNVIEQSNKASRPLVSAGRGVTVLSKRTAPNESAVDSTEAQVEHRAGKMSGSISFTATVETKSAGATTHHADQLPQACSTVVTDDSSSFTRPQFSKHLMDQSSTGFQAQSTSRDPGVSGRRLGPRLASLGRRGVKSKEIIGYPTHEEDRCPTFQRESMPGPYIEGAIDRGPRSCVPSVYEAGNKPQEPSSKLHQLAPLANPATRGKKAAKSSDAAGQLPQTVVPANPALESLGETSRRTKPLGQAERAEEIVSDIPVQSSRKLPGFAKANGGPWSREAHDLLENRRPS